MANKKHFRILPIFIFLAVLTLSVKVNNVFDLLKHPENLKLSISQQSAFAEEKTAPETEKLSQVLDQNAQNSSALGLNTENPNNGFSQSEILILQELAERREALDLRAKEIDRKAIQLKVAEEEIDKKIKQLQDYEQRLKKLMIEYNQEEKDKITSLAKLYTTMKPKDAARIFNTLEMSILVPLLKEMKPSASSAILSQMNSEKAKAVTTELIGHNY
jgi:COG3334: uncharacterized conserved protein